MTDQILTLDVGPSQLIAKLCDEIRLEEIINEQVTWDKTRCGLSPGTRIKALIINILCDGNPLYKVHETYDKLDVELLFGASVTKDQFNDDSLGRALDYLYKAVPWKVYTSVSLSALKALELSLGALHNDTTSISVYGEYSNQEPNSESDSESKLDITHGYSKQRRPDLKQIVMGMSVTPERIPVLANVEDGNTSDKKWNMEFIKKLREILSDNEWENLLYQADSALITTDNLRDLHSYSLTFLSRLPDTFGLSSELKTKAWSKDSWTDIGKLTDKKDAAEYRYQVFEEKLDERSYRFSVVHSSQLDKQKAKRLVHEIEKEEKGLNKEIKKLQETAFHCEADAEEAKISFEQEHKPSLHQYKLATYTEEETIKRKRRGRPKKEKK